MKKWFLLILCSVLMFGCSDPVSKNQEDDRFPLIVQDTFRVKILHYRGSEDVYELAASQDVQLFNKLVGDGEKYIIQRNFITNSLVFDISKIHTNCYEGDLIFKVDGQVVKTDTSKWGRTALTLPDENFHSVEISAPSSCNQWNVVFDIVPSDQPGEIFSANDIFYLSFTPRLNYIRGWSYKKGSLFFTVKPPVKSQYFMGDTTLSKCKLANGSDTLVIPFSFEKFENRLGTVASINADSAELVNFLGSRPQNNTISCVLYYQSWKVFKTVESVKSFGPIDVYFRMEEPRFLIGEEGGFFNVKRKSGSGSYTVFTRVKERATGLFKYSMIESSTNLEQYMPSFYPKDSLGGTLDIDSVYVYVFPMIMADQKSYEITSNMWYLYFHWEYENEEKKKLIETVQKDYFTEFKGFNPHTWMSTAAWAKEPTPKIEAKSSSSSIFISPMSSSSRRNECNESNVGEMNLMNVDGHEGYYVCESGKWRNADDNEELMMKSCTKANDMEFYPQEYEGIVGYMLCKNSSWNVATVYDYDVMDYTNPNVNYGQYVDKRDNRTYKTVGIGTQIWFAENLAYGADSIAGVFCPDHNSKNCAIGGALYSLSTSDLENLVQGMCPEGWKIPSAKDWIVLEDYVKTHKKAETVAGAMKAKGAWNFDDDEKISDEFGFSAIPALYDFGVSFASTTKDDNENTCYYTFDLTQGNGQVNTGYSCGEKITFLIRCLKK